MKYLSYVDSIQRDADRHWQRGMVHSVMGRPLYAVGSYAKAIKFQRRAEDNKQFWLKLRPTEPLAEAFASDVEKSFSEMFGL